MHVFILHIRCTYCQQVSLREHQRPPDLNPSPYPTPDNPCTNVHVQVQTCVKLTDMNSEGGTPTTLGQLILPRLVELGMSQADLAKKADVPATTLSSWLRGARGTGGRGPDPEPLRRIARTLKLDVDAVYLAAGRWAPDKPQAEDEQMILTFYRGIAPEDRPVVHAVLRALYDKVAARADPRPPRLLEESDAS